MRRNASRGSFRRKLRGISPVDTRGPMLAYDTNTHQHIDRTFGSQCLRAHGVRKERPGQLGCSGQLGGEQAVLGVHAATARLLESEEQVDESGEVDARGSTIMDAGQATTAGIASRPQNWGTSFHGVPCEPPKPLQHVYECGLGWRLTHPETRCSMAKTLSTRPNKRTSACTHGLLDNLIMYT